ncbi:hypothetical protein AU15_20940 [Marinobacter salarius]|uniref:Peptidoglycan binding-like domain-containing protein n=1 Tax=Marinobacter salarius TaxID=1420917 RepID=W5Z4P2_9GAMM|nr:hypothetical protein AU15_20940 [Marinobacter salarius]
MAAGRKGSRGFSGLVDLVSDLSDLRPLDELQKQEITETPPDTQISEREPKSNQNQTPARTSSESSAGMGGDTQFVLWTLAIVFLVILYAGSQSSDQESSIYSADSDASTNSGYEGAGNNNDIESDFSDLSSDDLNSDSTVETQLAASNGSEPSRYDDVLLQYIKPSVGTNNVLSIAEIRWCVRGGMEIEAMRGVFSSNDGVDKFNAIVDDYNRRCGSYRYREGNLGLAQRQVEEWRVAIENEAKDKARQMDQIASTSTTAPSSSLSGDTGPSKAMVKEVQMLLRVLRFGPGVADGIMGPRTEEAVRAFQRSKGMHATGQINSFLLQDLRQEYRRKYPSQ